MINNAVLQFLLRELTGTGENECGCLKVDRVKQILCVLGSKWRALSVHSLCGGTHIQHFRVQTHAPLHCVLLNVTGVLKTTCPSVLQIMSILICTYPARLMPAWNSNFTAQTQVEAAFTAPTGCDFSLSDEERKI